MSITISLQFLIGMSVGFPLGLIVYHIIQKRNDVVCIEKLVNIILVLTWLGLHIAGFFLDKDIPIIFDMIGGGAVGHLIGFDVGNVIESLKNRKKIFK